MPDATFPSHASVAAVGGGAMGSSVLYHLAKLGVSDAILLERSQFASGTIWHSAAQMRALRSSRRLTRLTGYSIDLHSGLEAETGQPVGWINSGSLSIATTQDRLARIAHQQALACAYGLFAELISASETRERRPLMSGDDIVGAVWSSGDKTCDCAEL